MTIDEMIEKLEEAREGMGGATEVRVAYQPNWPLRGTVADVTIPPSEDPYEDGERAAGQDNDASMLWLAVGTAPYEENPYAPKWAWSESAW